jgi:hypothetical protein
MKSKMMVFVMLFVFCLSYISEGKTFKLKDPTTAVYWSMGSMILPSVPLAVTSVVSETHAFFGATGVGLCIAGVIVGPSVGHFYAGNYMRGFASIGLRAGIAGLGFLVVVGVISSYGIDDIGAAIIGAALIGGAGIGILASGIYDIWTCPDAVRKYNRSIRTQGGLYFAPEINLTENSYGLTLGYSF